MGMSTHVFGLRQRDEAFERHYRVLETCMDSKVSLPIETAEYFRGHIDEGSPEYIAEMALMVDLDKIVRHENSVDMREDHVIDISDLPESVTRIVFRNSW